MLSKTLALIHNAVEQKHAPFADELSRIEEDFHRMADFFAMGNIDPDLEKVYKNLENRANKLLQQAELYILTEENGFYKKMLADTRGRYTLDLEELQRKLEDFVIDLTMLDLEADNEAKAEKRNQIFIKQHEYRKVVFAQITLAILDKENAEALKAIILSSSIDAIDAQLIITALMLSCLSKFDENKSRLLYDIYSQSENSEIKEKALVSYLLTTAKSPRNFSLQQDNIPSSLLSQIQQQIFFTIDSPRVEKIMQNDIMPDIIKNSEFDFQNNRIIPRKKDKIDDILNPHKDEEMLEKMEETMKKMKQLQEQGSDLFFGGFRYVKNHPFFSDVINWFCPFYFDHPQLPRFENEDDQRITSKLIERTPFCDSDKYSFVISMRKAIGTIPAEMKQMLKNGEAQLDIVGGGEVIHNETFIRRSYLQDIFRFFKICSWSKMIPNPLDAKNCLVILNFISGENHQYDETAISCLKALRKFEAKDLSKRILNSWRPNTNEGRIFKAFSLIDTDNVEARELFQDILKNDPHNIQALYGITKSCFADFKNAIIWQQYKEDAINSLLALYFKNENDISVLHTLVKAYLMAGDNEKALKYSLELIEKNKAEAFIKSFVGICRFAQNDILQAISLFRQSGERFAKIALSAEDYNMKFSAVQCDILRHILK